MPWGLQKLKPGVHKTINADKLAKFDRGFQPKRNKYKQKKLLEEQKRKRAQEEAAKAYEDFVESFKVNENETGQAGVSFVEGGTMGGTGGTGRAGLGSGRAGLGSGRGGLGSDRPGLGSSSSGSSSRGGISFVSADDPKPSRSSTKRKTPTGKSSKGMEMINPFASAAQLQTGGRRKKKKKGGQKKKSNMESFLEELKRESQLKEIRKKAGIPEPQPIAPPPVSDKSMGHHDTGDPTTTNIYVGNLSPQITEEFLVREFGRFGDIASVKIMWPRTAEERARNRNCGFVSFMKRPDAEDAIRELQGKEYFGFAMRLGWGKKVTLPSQPLKIPALGESLSAVQDKPLIEQAFEIPSDAPRNEVKPPSDPKVKRLIDRLARYVAICGHIFEKAVMTKEIKNPRFFFLYQAHSPAHIYYRWRVYALSQGDTELKWRTEPFQMLLGGPYWMPPKLEDMQAATAPAEKEREKSPSRRSRRDRERRSRSRERDRRDRRRRGSSRRLRSRERDEFEDRLRGLSLNRTKIAYGMGFALDHAEEAKEIVEIITESLSLDETPIPKKVARLCLVSDILYNSTAPVRNASAYRTEFREHLPKIFKSLHRTYKNIEGRITANAMRERVTKVLRVWQVWSLYPETFVNDLETTFLGKEANQRVVVEPAPEEKKEPKKVNLLGGAYDSDDDDGKDADAANPNKLAGLIPDIDGAPLDEDIDGEPVDDDVDGMPIDDGDDIDGVPVP